MSYMKPWVEKIRNTVKVLSISEEIVTYITLLKINLNYLLKTFLIIIFSQPICYFEEFFNFACCFSTFLFFNFLFFLYLIFKIAMKYNMY